MTDFALAEAQDAAPAALVADLAAQLAAPTPARPFNLGFVYATSALAGSFAEIVAGLRRRTGIANWVGTVGHGICATGREYFDEPAVVALAGHFPDGSAEIIPSIAGPETVAAKPSAWMAAATALCHAAGFEPPLICTPEELASEGES